MLKTRVVTALILLALLLLIVFSNSFLLFVLALVTFFSAAVWESLRLFGIKHSIAGTILCTGVFVFILLKATILSNNNVLFGACAAIWVFRFVPSLRLGLPALHSLSNRLLACAYLIAIFGCFFAITILFKHSASYLLSVLAIVWIADTGAYFSGKAFGKNKLAPNISPGKSWEGAFGGWFSVIFFASVTTVLPYLNDTFVARIYAKWGMIGLFGATLILVAASITGDLFESQLKRRASIKDSSNLIPGHGGVLDRLDAVIPVLPLAILFDSWL